MKTKRSLLSTHRPARVGPTVLLVFLATFTATLLAQPGKKNPTSKIFVSDVSGDAQIDTGDNIQDLNKRSVYTAEGTVIETKTATNPKDKGKIFSSMVFSNGTGAYFDEDTKVEMKRFQQEPFTPNRSDMDTEPSISQTHAFVARGTVGLCTSKLVAGSNMTYSTSQGSINIRGKKVVIEAKDGETKISMLEGDSTVKGGNLDMGGNVLHAGEQAIIRQGGAGQPNTVSVQRIPPSEAAKLDDKVAQACMAKKTVYFEVKERVITEAGPAAKEAVVAATDTKSAEATTSTPETPTTTTTASTTESATSSSATADTTKTSTTSSSSSTVSTTTANTSSSSTTPSSTPASGSSVFASTPANTSSVSSPFASTPANNTSAAITAFDNSSTASGASTFASNSPAVTAFDGPVANSPVTFTPIRTTVQEIVAVPVVPVTIPVQYTVSPARIVTTPGG